VREKIFGFSSTGREAAGFGKIFHNRSPATSL
jgi:hypothetical protein